jgi:hypothetical protein
MALQVQGTWNAAETPSEAGATATGGKPLPLKMGTLLEHVVAGFETRNQQSTIFVALNDYHWTAC